MRLSFVAWVILITITISADMNAQIPRQVSYQGLLSDSAGNFKPDGSYSISFRLYTSASGGSALWVETKTLQVRRGLFYTILGDVTAFPGSVKFDQQYWLSIQVSGEAELTKRLQFTPVPYSITSIISDTAKYSLTAPIQSRADTATLALSIVDGIVTTTKIADGAVTQSKLGSGVTLPPGGAAGGDLIGTYPNPSINVNTITSEKIVDGSLQRIDVQSGFKAPYADTSDYAAAALPVGNAGGGLAGSYPSPLLANNSVTNAVIADGAVTNLKIAPGQVVKSVNGLHDGVTLSAAGGATISSSGDTIIINAGSGGGGVGIQGVQNTNNTLDVLNPNGPTATINVKSLGITGAYIANGAVDSNKLGPSSVTTPKMMDASVTQSKIANGVTLPPSGVAGGDLIGAYPTPSIANNVISTLNIQNGTILRADVDPNFKAPKADSADYVRNPSATTDSARIAGTVPDNAIVNAKIQDGTITPAKLAFTPGTVTNIATGSGLTGGPIATSGTISIAASGVTNGMLQNSSVNLNAGPGLSGGGSVSLGGATSLRMPLSGVTPGTYTHATVRVDSLGRIDSAASRPINLATADVTGTLPVGHGGTGTATSMSAGSVVFADVGGMYNQDNANFFWDKSTARLGIGTASPGARLDVEGGKIKITDGTEGVGKVLTSDASGVASWQTPAGGIGGSGAADYIPKFTASTSIGNSAIYNDSINNIGIGTTTPNTKLDIRGNLFGLSLQNSAGANTDDIIVKRPGNLSPINIRFSLSERASNTNLWLYGYDGTTFKNFIGFDYPSNKVFFPANESTLVADNGNRRVGIGTSSPAGRLHVDGTEWSTNPVLIKGLPGPVIGPTIEMDATDGTGGERYSIISTNSGAGAGAGKFSIYHNGPSGFGYSFVINSSGDVGVGLTNPNSRLHVSGSISTALITAAADLTLGDPHSVVLCDGPAGTPLNINLPSAVGIAGRQYTIKNIAGNSPVNIKPFNTETIDGTGAYALLVTFQYVVLVSNGADWFVVGNN